jgi:hypothetical protein
MYLHKEPADNKAKTGNKPENKETLIDNPGQSHHPPLQMNRQDRVESGSPRPSQKRCNSKVQLVVPLTEAHTQFLEPQTQTGRSKSLIHYTLLLRN